MSPFETFRAVLVKDARVELRARETLVTLAFFALVLSLVFTFGFSGDELTNRILFPGCLWAIVLFAGTLATGRTFAREARDGAFAALVGSPAHRGGILAAKVTLNFALSLFVALLAAPLLAVLLRVDAAAHLAPLVGQLTLGVLGFALVGTPLAVVAVNARFAEVLLPMLVFPLVTPVLIAGVSATAATLGTVPDQDVGPWWQLLIAFDVVYGIGGQLIFEQLVTE
jgi:heme exporter protein B